MSPWPDSLCLVTPWRVEAPPHAHYILPGTCFCLVRVCVVGTMWLSFRFHPGKTVVWIKERNSWYNVMRKMGEEPCKSGHQLSTRVPKHSGCLSPSAMAWLRSPPAVTWRPSPPAVTWWPSPPAVRRLSLRGPGPASVKHVKEKGRGSVAFVQFAGNRGLSFPAGKGEKMKQYLPSSLEQSPGIPWMVPEVHARPWVKSISTPWSPYHRLTDQDLCEKPQKTLGLGAVPSGSSTLTSGSLGAVPGVGASL